MRYKKSEIEYWVSEVLGTGNIEGLFVDDGVCSGYAEPQDYEILTDIESGTTINEDVKGARIKFGATKLVIVPNEGNYVIKMPFTGIYHTERGKYDENDDWVPYDTYDFRLVSHTSGNVCDEEIAMMQDFTDELNSIIAEQEFVFWYGNVPIYIQSKVSEPSAWLPDVVINTEYSLTKRAIASKIQADHSRYYKGFILRLIKMFGIQKANNILYEMDECIYDLHDENLGYDKNGNCVLFDIAGYDSQQWFNYDN